MVDDLSTLKDDMIAFIEGHGMRRFHGYASEDEVQAIMWHSPDQSDGWKDFVELAKHSGAPFLTIIVSKSPYRLNARDPCSRITRFPNPAKSPANATTPSWMARALDPSFAAISMPFDADARGFGRSGGPGRGGPPFGRGPGGAPALRPEIINRLTSDLQLDASQQEQVKKILDERRDRFEQVHREARDRFDKEQRDLHDAIRAVLRPDQQQKFDTFLDRRR